MDVALLFASKYLRSADFQGRDVTLTIKHVGLEKLATEDGGEKAKGVVSFVETPKLWVLNRTNAIALAAMWGNETTKWHGHRVTLFPAKVTVGEEEMTGIRVRGSPDLEADMGIELKLPRKKARHVTLKKTAPRGGGRMAAAKSAKTAPVPEPVPAEPETGLPPEADPETGVVPFEDGEAAL